MLIKFTVKPKLSPLAEYTKVIQHTSHTILCSLISGSKPVFFQWNKNGSPIDSGSFSSNALFSALAFENITSADAGTYLCLVKNAFGSDSTQTRIDVKG